MTWLQPFLLYCQCCCLPFELCSLYSGNHRHGSYCNGDKLQARQDCFEKYLCSKEEDYYASLVASMAYDRDVEDDLESCSVAADANEFLTSASVANRGQYASGRARVWSCLGQEKFANCHFCQPVLPRSKTRAGSVCRRASGGSSRIGRWRLKL